MACIRYLLPLEGISLWIYGIPLCLRSPTTSVRVALFQYWWQAPIRSDEMRSFFSFFLSLRWRPASQTRLCKYCYIFKKAHKPARSKKRKNICIARYRYPPPFHLSDSRSPHYFLSLLSALISLPPLMICRNTCLKSLSFWLMCFFPFSVGQYSLDFPETLISRYPLSMRSWRRV